MHIVWVILHHEYRCLQCRRHKHSPYHRMVVAVFCRIFWGLVLPLSHLIIHPVQEWSGFQRHFWFCFGVRIHLIVFNNVSVRVLCGYNRSLRSIFHQFIRFPLLRRPSFINIPCWVAWWVCVYNGSPRSIMLLSLRAQRNLTFVSGFHLAFDAIERSTLGVLSLHRKNKFTIDFDFAVTLSSPDSFCVLFDITSELSIELKWLMLNKHKRWFPFVTCEVSLGQYVCELVCSVNVFDLDLGVQINSIK